MTERKVGRVMGEAERGVNQVGGGAGEADWVRSGRVGEVAWRARGVRDGERSTRIATAVYETILA